MCAHASPSSLRDDQPRGYSEGPACQKQPIDRAEKGTEICVPDNIFEGSDCREETQTHILGISLSKYTG